MLIDKQQIARRVREAREYKDITQLEMAGQLNIARQTYLDIESGKTEPKILSLATIASVTGYPLAWLLYGDNDAVDVRFVYRDEINTLLALFADLPPSARDLVMLQTLELAEHMAKMVPNEVA